MLKARTPLTLAALALLLATIAACGGSTSGGNATASGSVPAAGSSPAAAGKADANSPACRYATGLLKSLLALAFTVPPNTVSIDAGSTADDIKRYVDTEAQASALAVASIKKLTPPAGFKELHADLLGVYTGMNQQLLDAQKALATGDTGKAGDLLIAANTNLSGLGGIDLDAKYPAQSAQLNACPN